MKPRERIFSALHLEEPDRVPMFELIVNAIVADEIVGQRYPAVATNPPGTEALKLGREKMIKGAVKGHILCYRKLKIDMLSVFPSPPIQFQPKFKDENTIIDEWGTTFQYTPEADQAFVVDNPIKKPEDLEGYVFPDPLAEGRLDVPALAVKMAGDMAVSSWLHGLSEFTIANLMGFKGFSTFLYMYPNLLVKILDELTYFITELGKALIDVGVEVIWFGNDTAYNSGPFMSPEVHRKYFIPRLTKIVDVLHKKGALVIQHSCGNTYSLIEDWLSTGVDALHPFEPRAGMDIAFAKQKYGHRVCIMGNIDVSYTLPFGDPSDVEREVKERITALAPGGGYILTSSNSISKAISPKNAISMFNAGLKYGSYSHIR